MTNTSFHIGASNLLDPFTAVRTCAGSDKADTNTNAVVRVRIFDGLGVVLECTDRLSFAQSWVPLSDDTEWPKDKEGSLYSVVDTSNRLAGLLAHGARQDEVVEVVR